MRYKDTLKANLKKCNIDIRTWETDAMNRDFWHATTHEGAVFFETSR